MKHFIAFAIFILASFSQLVTPCYADKPEAKKFPTERVTKETALYVETLELKGDAAEKFTKLYMEYRRKIHNAVEKNRPPYKGDPTQLTDEQNDKNIRARFASSREILDIREQYYPKFLKIITPAQYDKLNKLEQKVFERSRHEHQRRSSTTHKSPANSNKTSNHNHSSSKSKPSTQCPVSKPVPADLVSFQLKMNDLKSSMNDFKSNMIEFKSTMNQAKKELKKEMELKLHRLRTI